MLPLLQQHCKHYTKDDIQLSDSDISTLITQIDGWSLNSSNTKIFKKIKFKNYYQTTAFINAVAWICHQQDHHPDINFNYNSCCIEFTTHSINGLSLNDFICAAHINIL